MREIVRKMCFVGLLAVSRVGSGWTVEAVASGCVASAPWIPYESFSAKVSQRASAGVYLEINSRVLLIFQPMGGFFGRSIRRDRRSRPQVEVGHRRICSLEPMRSNGFRNQPWHLEKKNEMGGFCSWEKNRKKTVADFPG